MSAGLDLTAVVAVAVTHHHSDHVSDLATFATARWTAGARSALTVIAPSGAAARYAERCLGVFDDQSFHGQAPPEAGPRPEIVVHAFVASNELSSIYTSGAWRLSSVLVQHPPVRPAVGYRVEHDRERVAISGDTAVCDGMRRLAQGADVLVHEALLSDRVSAGLLEWNAGARTVSDLAARALVHTLVLTHLIPAPTTAEDEQAYLDEVRTGGFTGPTIVANDLLRLAITNPGRIEQQPDAHDG
jgi:ribonuclease Z